MTPSSSRGPARGFLEEVAALWARTDDDSWPRFALADGSDFLVTSGATRMLCAPATAPLAPVLRGAASIGSLVVGAARFTPAGDDEAVVDPAWAPFGGAFFFAPKDVARGATGLAPAEPAVDERRRVVLVEPSGGHYRRALTAAIDAIDDGVLDKVVVARQLELRDVDGCAIDLIPRVPELVRSLLASGTFAGGRVFLLALSPDAVWLGATPERLAHVAGAVVETEAVAGTCVLGEDAAANEAAIAALLASDKERREHDAVVMHLRASLRRLGAMLEPPQREVPRVRRLRGLAHLVTPLRARIPSSVPPADVVAALHPTPAMNGVPSSAAGKFLATHEGLDRGFYAGPIGFTMNGAAAFDVGIRGALLGRVGARLYVGSGIVRGSTVEGEARETADKGRAIAAAMGFDVRDVREASP